jgi:hypothetical protein
MPQIYYGNEVLRETESIDRPKDSPPIGSLRFLNGGDGSLFEWANGNPLKIAPPGGLTIFHCYYSNGNYEFLKTPGNKGGCIPKIWVISAIS